MKLLRLDNFQVEFEDELLLLKPFRTLYKKDRSKGKEDFLNFLTILYFVYDPRSDYNYIVDVEQRLQEVYDTNGIEKKKFTELEQQCVDLYVRESTTTSFQVLDSMRRAIHNLQVELDRVDYSILEEKDKVNAMKTVASILGMLPKSLKDLQDTERTVAREIEEAGKLRGSATKTLMDDGLLL